MHILRHTDSCWGLAQNRGVHMFHNEHLCNMAVSPKKNCRHFTGSKYNNEDSTNTSKSDLLSTGLQSTSPCFRSPAWGVGEIGNIRIPWKPQKGLRPQKWHLRWPKSAAPAGVCGQKSRQKSWETRTAPETLPFARHLWRKGARWVDSRRNIEPTW